MGQIYNEVIGFYKRDKKQFSYALTLILVGFSIIVLSTWL